jgi:hypothetical protein
MGVYGYIDDFRIYNKVLSYDEIYALSGYTQSTK